ncbi:hypothetical protein MLD38_011930 [Melastoma candidum]|uniref:Uncharacterized protein n=1 Tax=Melastoma candidum TaxID=119954 RepID=A0ACB9R8U5_9MYRT|nr:hypothetical protein MLD38_011930 [Melastoma candidum]
MSDASSLLGSDTGPVDVEVGDGEVIVDSSGKRSEQNDDEEDPASVLPPEQEEEEEEMTQITKKYGGLLLRKPPLISQDHERAFFDSADWALAKQGPHKQPRGPLEPKLQRSPQQQMRSRRSAYAPHSPSVESSLSPGFDTGSSNAAQSNELCESNDRSQEGVSPGEGYLPGQDAEEALSVRGRVGN